MPCEYDQMRLTNSWWEVGYLQSVEELPGPPKINPSSGRVEDLNPGPPEYKSSALQLGHARLLSLSVLILVVADLKVVWNP